VRGTGLPLNRHRELGRQLWDVNNLLVDLQPELADAYPNSRVLVSHLNQLTRGLAGLRDELEEKLFQEHPTEADQTIYRPRRWREP
jgi:hypothetical protein